MVTIKSNTVGKFVVNTAILLAKSAGSSKLRIAVKGGVVTVTVGMGMVTGAFATLRLGSIKIGKGAILERNGGLKGLTGYKKNGAILG